MFRRFPPPVAGLDQIRRFHHVLCERLQSLKKNIGKRQRSSSSEVRLEEPLRGEAYKLRDTLPIVFIVLDGDWQEHGHTARVVEERGY